MVSIIPRTSPSGKLSILSLSPPNRKMSRTSSSFFRTNRPSATYFVYRMEQKKQTITTSAAVLTAISLFWRKVSSKSAAPKNGIIAATLSFSNQSASLFAQAVKSSSPVFQATKLKKKRNQLFRNAMPTSNVPINVKVVFGLVTKKWPKIEAIVIKIITLNTCLNFLYSFSQNPIGIVVPRHG